MSTAIYSDLHDVIEDSLTDSQLPAEETSTDSSETPTETSETAPEASTALPEASTPTTSVANATAKPEVEPDEFEKKFGIAQREPGGRENRIPYTRVKRITEKAVSDAKKEWESTTTPRIHEFETKQKDYEQRLERVAQFENVMVGDPDKFLNMLATLPAYKSFFDHVRASYAAPQPPTNGAAAPVVDDGMPSPDQELSDGTHVYSMDGLKQLLKWQADQVEQRVTKKYEERYSPIEKEWQATQRVQSVIPHVRAQIENARTWHLFNENEGEIVEALKADQKLSLEGAYQKVVFPKLVIDRNKMREEILKEVKQAPRSTSATTSSTRGAAPAPTGPRSLESVIEESIKSLK